MRHRDPFNDVETAIVHSLTYGRDEDALLLDNNGDPIEDLTLCSIHEKMRRDPEGWPTYYENETPAIGVYASSKGPDDESSVGLSTLTIDVVMDVVVIGGHVKEIDTQMKQIVGCIDQFFRDILACKTDDADDGITHIATTYSVGRGLMNPPYMGEHAWIAEGATSLQVQIRTEA